MKNRKVKSNRAQADYFELLVCQYICHLAGVRFSYSKNIAILCNKVLKVPNGKARLELQNNNLIKLSPKIKEIIHLEIKRKGKIIEVKWVGRKLTIKTTSDIDAEHISKKLTRFSIKSIEGQGFGTIKNLGLNSLQRYLGINFELENQKMWRELRSFTKQYNTSQQTLKKLVRTNKTWLHWATNNGKRYQTRLNELCYNAFNKLNNKDKVGFLNFILDAEDSNLYVIIINAAGIVIYKPLEDKLGLTDNIIAKKNSEVGYTILVNKVPTYRIQTNNTNGIGISPFCQRVFFY